MALGRFLGGATTEPAGPPELSFEEFELDEQYGWSNAAEPGEAQVTYQQKPDVAVGTKNKTEFRNTLPSRSQRPEPQPEIQEPDETLSGFFGLGNALNAMKDSVESVTENVSKVGSGFFNAVTSPFFSFQDDNTEDLSEAEDPDSTLLRDGSPYVVLNDEKTGTRVKMERESARAYSGVKRELAKKGKADKVTLQENYSQGTDIVSMAENWVGKEFEPGAGEQCANFVRSVCNQMGIKVGASANPVDKHLTGDAQGPAYANSFFGEDVGTLIRDQEDLMPGDIVGFTNTYGDYAPGTITHVGIYAGNGQVIDRPTANAPVKKRSVESLGGVYIGVRPYSGGKAGARVGAHSIAVDPSDEDAVRTAVEFGFTPTKRRGVLSYMGAHELEDEMLGGGDEPPIPYESDVDWNADMERAYSAAWDVDVDPDVFMNLIKQESSWNPNARNKQSGAFGLTQLMPATAMEQARAMGIDASVDEIKRDPELQTLIGAGYYKRMLDMFGNHPQALAAYNAGPGRVDAILKGEAEIPEETVDYVSRILKLKPEKAESLIRNFSGEYSATMQKKPEEFGGPEPTTSGKPGSFIKERELEVEAGVGFFTPKSLDEEKEMLEGLRKSEKKLPPEMQNLGAQRKERAAKELVSSLSSTDNREGDWGTIAKSMAASTTGMVVGALDEIASRVNLGNTAGAGLAKELTKRIYGEDQAEKLNLSSPMLSMVEAVLGSSPQVKDDFEFGKLRTSKWLKGFGNTLSFGIMNYFSPNGTIYTEEELQNSEQIKEAARQQGGLIMGDKPVDPKSWHATYLNMMSDISDNPLSLLAIPLQMQAMASLGTSTALTNVAAQQGARGTLAKNAQAFLNYMGGKAAAGKGSSWVSQALTNSAIRFEVSTGILGGVEVFNNSLAQNLEAAGDGRITIGEAFAEATQSATIATGLGLMLGLTGTGGGLLLQQTKKGLRGIGSEIAEKPLVKGTRFGKSITEGVQWAASKLRAIDESERFAHIKEIRNNLSAGAKDMYDRHVGRFVEDWAASRAQTIRRDSMTREAYHMDTVSRKMDNKATEALELLRTAEDNVKQNNQKLDAMVQSREQVRGLGNDPLTALDTSVQRIREAQQGLVKINQAIAQEKQIAGGPGRVTDTMKELQKQQIELNSLIKELESEIIKYKGEVQQVANENGIIFMNHNGKPATFAQLESQIEGFKDRIAKMPEQEFLKDAEVIRNLARDQQLAAQLARKKAAEYREFGEGRRPLPEEGDVDPWTPVPDDVDASNLESHIWSMYNRPGNVLPDDRILELENLIMSQAPMQKTLGSIEHFIGSMDKLLQKSTKEQKAILGPQIENVKNTLEEAHKSGKNAWAVMEDLRKGGGDTILDAAILKNLATRTPDDVQVPLYKLSQESNATRMALLSKLSEMNYGDARIQAKKILDTLRQNVDWEREKSPVQGIIDSIVSLRIGEVRGDLSKEAGGTGFFKDSMMGKTTAKERLDTAKAGYQAARDSGQSRRRAVMQAVSDAFGTMTKNSDPLNLVRATGREMVSAKRAYSNLGGLIQEAVDAPDGIFKTGVRKYISNLPEVDNSTNIIGKELRTVIDAADDPEEAASNFIADLLFEGGDRLKEAVKEIPELRDVVSPVIQIHDTLDHLGLLAPDVKAMSDHFYIKAFFPAMNRYDELMGFPSRNSRKILEETGVINDKGKPIKSLTDIDEMVRSAENKLGTVDAEKYIQMSMPERQAALGKSTGNLDPEGNVLPVSEDDAMEVLAGLLMKNRLRNPGEVANARVASIGNAETQRKFLLRLASATDENNQPLVWVPKGDDTKAPEGYRAITNIDKIHSRDYELFGKVYPANQIHMKKEALEIYDDIMGDWSLGDSSGVATERVLRSINALALQGSHTPFLATIGAEVWRGFGFNMAKTARAFNIREGMSTADWAKVAVRAAQAGLEDQDVSRNATLLSKAFAQDNREILSDASKTLFQQPNGAAALEHLKRIWTGDGAEGVVGRGMKVGGNVLDGAIAFDEFLMDNLLFQNLRDAQYGLWMFKANELEAKMAPKMIKEGYAPEAVRDLAEREAATYVNTFTGSVEKGMMSKNARGLFGFFGMTPQFTAARLRAVSGAISENTFRHMPEGSRKRLVGEYQSHLTKMAAAGLASSALFQYALSGRSIVDNPEDKQFKIWAGGDHYFSNPLATVLNTVSKLTGTQELGRMLSLSAQEQLGFEVPKDRLNPMERDSLPGAIVGGVGAMVGQIGRQAANLTNPLLRTGLQSTIGMSEPSVNAGEEAQVGSKQALSKNFGLYQFITNTDPWTGDKQPAWHRATDFLGIYTSKNTDVKSFDMKVRKMKKNTKDLIRRDTGTKLKAAYEYQAAGDMETAERLYREAYIAADPVSSQYPQGKYPGQGGVEVNKEVRRLLRKDEALGRDGRMRFTEQEWFNAVKAARYPEEYQLERATTNARGDAAAELRTKREGVRDVKENRGNMGALGSFGDFVGEL